MPEQIYKLSPHRDLQCYFLTPSAVAAMSQASDAGFTVSGKWRQQFDWTVVEWNRDNVFEHPALRYLPDGDLSRLILTYDEERRGCIPIESNLYPVVSWDQLRLWVSNGDGTETVYYVNVKDHATPIAGSYVPASATMTLNASPAVGKRAGLAFLEEHHYYTVLDGDDLAHIAAGIALDIQQLSQTFSATSSGASVIVTWNPKSTGAPYQNLLAANGNRITMYGFAEDGAAVWQEAAAEFSGGQFPTKYQVTFDFANLAGKTDANPTDTTQPVPTQNVRKLRWTWAADLQPASFVQGEFQVTISNWTVSGANRQYTVAGAGSRRIEDTDSAVTYAGSWILESGNFSGSKIRSTSNVNDSCTIVYSETAEHQLFLGTRLLTSGASVSVSIDGQLRAIDLLLNGEDILVRVPLGSYAAGTHSIAVTHAGPMGNVVYFDFLEIAYPSGDLPDFEPQAQLSLATDWDTYHSQSLPAERTAWLINKLGFRGRVNHYTGALWFYELVRTGTQYASLTVTLTPPTDLSNANVQLGFAAPGEPDSPTFVSHLVLVDDTPANVSQALAALINIGTNLIWASADGDQLTFTARAMGEAGNGITVQLGPQSEGYTLTATSNVLSGGIDGTPYDLDPTDPLNKTLKTAADYWRTDLTALPRINRAARDWHFAYFGALQGYGIESVASFSTELMNGDPSEQAGIVQRYPDGTAVVVNTPAIQTNFSPTSLAFWTQVYLDMATLQSSAGTIPYLQSGEVQWWYFQRQVWDAEQGANVDIGMPFYDDYTKQQFLATYGVPMQTILDNSVDPAQYPNETAFLPTLIGAYTAAIRNALQTQFPGCRYEVLYPTDTNDTPFNQLINFPENDWTPANLSCLKTESFTFTGNHNLDQSTYSMGVSAAKGFPNEQRSHLIGVGDSWAAWMKEADIAQSQGLESVVLFALDQYCLVGYSAPPFVKLIRSQRQG